MKQGPFRGAKRFSDSEEIFCVLRKPIIHLSHSKAPTNSHFFFSDHRPVINVINR